MSPHRPHVAIVDVTARMGGAQRSMLALVKALTDDVRFTFVLPEVGELADLARAAGADVRVVPWADALLAVGERNGGLSVLRGLAALPGLCGAALRLRRTIRAIAPDLIVTNGIKPHLVTGLALAPRPCVPLVWYLRESVEGKTLSRALLARFARTCSGAIAISRFVTSDAETYLPPSVPRTIVFNILDVATAADAPGRQQETKRPGDVWFATIGGLTPLKGQDLFLRAAARIGDALPGARFLIIGSAMYRPEAHMNYLQTLRNLSEELGLDGRVDFLGQRDDVPALLQHVDVVVQPNRGPEGFGRAAAEAMSAGVAVIASNGWGLSELVQHDQTGWLVEPGDVAALAEAMLTLGSDAALRHRLAENGRRWTATHLSAARSAADFLAFITARLA